MNVDVLAVGPHPDDVEVGIGGLIHKLCGQGYAVGILDLTRGELGTRGTVHERTQEAENAAAVLGVASRESAELPDGGLANTQDQRERLIPLLRRFRPKVLLAPHHSDRHPDHEAAHYLVRDANYLAGLSRIDTGQDPHRTAIVYYYRVYQDPAPPDMVVDISAQFETKQAALRAYGSQFFNPDYAGKGTYVSSKAFWDYIRTRAAYWGARIGVEYGEPLYAEGPLGVERLPGLEETA
ncbi:MAG: bacillithiol biosynthesis deacetylase BshB1 [Candidatus Hydrogenedentota bacterium]